MSLINVVKKMDIFEDIIGYEGLYQINRHGEIKSKQRILKNNKQKNGYIRINLSNSGKTKKHYIHRLIGLQFIPNPENKPTIDHIDRNRQNNSLDNLRWATHAEQNNNASFCAIVRGTTTEELTKISKKKSWTKKNAWLTISNQFRRILRE